MRNASRASINLHAQNSQLKTQKFLKLHQLSVMNADVGKP
jgi:hypothetical protein